MKKVAIYCRVSTALQEQEKTIESQLAELREICKDFQVVKEYIDNGWSGGTLDRPALDQLRNDAKEGLFEAVHVHSVDRLSRNLYQQGILVEELKKRGIEIFIGEKPIADTPEGRFMFNVLGAAAEYEKEKILERTRRGRLFKARKGIIVGHKAPYGYTYVKKNENKNGYYEINKEETEVVKLIFNLYLETKSVRGVAKELTKRNIKPRVGKNWRTSTLHRILRNESYIGTTYYNKNQAIEGNNKEKKYRRRVNTRLKLRNKNEWIPIQIPAILDKNIFNIVQDLLKKQHKNNQKKYFYLIGSGLIKCSNCGSTYSGEMSHNSPFYRCNERHRSFPLPRKCDAKMISAKRIEGVIWDSVSQAIMNPRILISHIKHLTMKISENQTALGKDKKEYLQEKEIIKQKKSRLLDIYTEGTISKDDYLQKIGELNLKEETLDSEIKEADAKLSQLIDRPLLIKDIKYFCNLAKQRINTFAPQVKQEFLGYLLDEIIFDSKRGMAKIIGYVPVEAEDIEKCFPITRGIEQYFPIKSGAMSTASLCRDRQALAKPYWQNQ